MHGARRRARGCPPSRLEPTTDDGRTAPRALNARRGPIETEGAPPEHAPSSTVHRRRATTGARDAETTSKAAHAGGRLHRAQLRHPAWGTRCITGFAAYAEPGPAFPPAASSAALRVPGLRAPYPTDWRARGSRREARRWHASSHAPRSSPPPPARPPARPETEGRRSALAAARVWGVACCACLCNVPSCQWIGIFFRFFFPLVARS